MLELVIGVSIAVAGERMLFNHSRHASPTGNFSHFQAALVYRQNSALVRAWSRHPSRGTCHDYTSRIQVTAAEINTDRATRVSIPVTNVTGGSSPITLHGQVVYAKTFSTALPSNCWESWRGSDFSYITYLQVKVSNYNAATYDEDGLDCLYGKLSDGIGPITAGSTCRRDGNAILLYAN